MVICVVPVTSISIPARLTEYDGSMFELWAVVEPYVCGICSTECVVVYLLWLATATSANGSVLMELEKAGDRGEPQLKRLARNALRQRAYTDGAIDDMLAPDHVSYEDLARASSDTSSTEPPSVLKSIFHGTPGNEGDHRGMALQEKGADAEIEAKEAIRELETSAFETWSSISGRRPVGETLIHYPALRPGGRIAGVILSRVPPSVLDAIPVPNTKEENGGRRTARLLRARFFEVTIRRWPIAWKPSLGFVMLQCPPALSDR